MACEESRTIPPEIITEILCRLPSKSIGRFRCVSKGWLSLLTDPHFIKTHKNTLNQHHVILISGHLTLKTIPKTHLKNHEQVLESAMTTEPSDLKSSRFYTRIYGSCNGLVLLAATDYDLVIFKLVVLNPTTGEFIELPEPHIYNYRYSIITFGFGYDCVTDDYKVVTITYNYAVHVYSLRTNTWRRVTGFPDDRVFDGEGERVSGVFVNGFIHWVVREKGDCDDEICLLVIVAFSLALETFTQMSLPLCNESMDVDYLIKNCLKLADLGGKLVIFQNVGGVFWLMTEYGVRESWTEISLKGFELDTLPRPMVFYDDNGNILVAIYGEILVYNIRKGRFPAFIKIFRSMDEGTYVESLISPKLNRTNWKSANSSKEICTEFK